MKLILQNSNIFGFDSEINKLKNDYSSWYKKWFSGGIKDLTDKEGKQFTAEKNELDNRADKIEDKIIDFYDKIQKEYYEKTKILKNIRAGMKP